MGIQLHGCPVRWGSSQVGVQLGGSHHERWQVGIERLLLTPSYTHLFRRVGDATAS